MRHAFWLGWLALLAASATGVFARQPDCPQLVEALRLRRAGMLQASITILESVVQDKSVSGKAVEKGIAWNLLGASYQASDRYDLARQAYRKALKYLGEDSLQSAEYASALDNLGSLDLALGNMRESWLLRKRAQKIDAKLGDAEGLVRTYVNLTMIALAEDRVRAAQKNIDNAFRVSKLALTLSSDDKGALLSAAGEVMSMRRQFASAVAYYRRAIQLWTEAYGKECPRLSLEYALLGKAQMQMDDWASAKGSLLTALKLADQRREGQNSSAYYKIELLYAELLKQDGAPDKGSELEWQAKTSLTNLLGRRCGECTVDVNSLTRP